MDGITDNAFLARRDDTGRMPLTVRLTPDDRVGLLRLAAMHNVCVDDLIELLVRDEFTQHLKRQSGQGN